MIIIFHLILDYYAQIVTAKLILLVALVMVLNKRKTRYEIHTCENIKVLSLKVEHPPYKWDAAERYRQDLPNT